MEKSLNFIAQFLCECWEGALIISDSIVGGGGQDAMNSY